MTNSKDFIVGMSIGAMAVLAIMLMDYSLGVIF